MSVQFNDIEKLPATAKELGKSGKWQDLMIALKIDVEAGKKIILKKIIIEGTQYERSSLRTALDKTFGKDVFDIITDVNPKILYVRTNPHKG